MSKKIFIILFLLIIAISLSFKALAKPVDRILSSKNNNLLIMDLMELINRILQKLMVINFMKDSPDGLKIAVINNAHSELRDYEQ
jgi:hypothetical protein